MRFAGCLLALPLALALDNGLSRTPYMGFNSWYDVFMSPTDASARSTMTWLKDNGFLAAGYNFYNLDDGVFESRDPTTKRMIVSSRQFPNGIQALVDFAHEQGFKFGIYTDRGTKTCGGRPGAEGFEHVDAQSFADWKMDLLKEDSCNAPGDRETAFKQYALMRDALNATGRPIVFNLCGWNPWYGPAGHALANSWRTGPDDVNWPGVLTNLDNVAELADDAGPGGWNDPDFLLATDSAGKQALTPLQSRAQFSLWSVVASPLILSQDVHRMTPYLRETYLNPEVIRVNQDTLGRAGIRLAGENVGNAQSLRSERCDSADAGQRWQFNQPMSGFLRNEGSSDQCLNINNCGQELIHYPCVTTGGTCCGATCYKNEQFSFMGNRLVSALNSRCVEEENVGDQLLLAPCSLTSAGQNWTYEQATRQIRSPITNRCIAISRGGGTNVWGRRLQDGAWALVFLNAMDTMQNITCDESCFARTSLYRLHATVRDLWSRSNEQPIVATSYTAVGVEPNGGVKMIRLTPVFDSIRKTVN